MDFLALETRHLGSLASAGPLWAAFPQEISHLLAPLLQNPLHGIAGRDIWATAEPFSTEYLEKGTEISW